MSQKIYDLTISYEEADNGSEVISAEGHPDDGKTRTQASLDRFLRRIRELEMKPDPADFSAIVVSVEEQE